MTREKDMFTSFQPSHDQSGNIVFGDNREGEVLGLGKIAISNDNLISNVLLVNTLR
jgi:ribosome biogenesis protein Nip4